VAKYSFSVGLWKKLHAPIISFSSFCQNDLILCISFIDLQTLSELSNKYDLRVFLDAMESVF